MLMKLLTDYRPRGVLVCLGREARRSGSSCDPEYKANRRPMPDLLREQQPHFKPLVEAFGYRNSQRPGREADDVIGTLSRIADEAGMPTCVVSTDRDAFQLVSDHVCLMMTPRGVADVARLHARARGSRALGIPPSCVPDCIGLKGDTGDNIKGVPGIGDKTAADLLREFGSLEGVYEHLDEVSGAEARGDAGRAARGQVRESKELGTIVPRPAGAGGARPGRGGRRAARPLDARRSSSAAGVPRPAGAPGRAGEHVPPQPRAATAAPRSTGAR